MLFFSLTLSACAELEKGAFGIGNIFKGNTKKNIVDYDLEDKTEYKRYRYIKQVEEEDKEKEILKRLEEDKDVETFKN